MWLHMCVCMNVCVCITMLVSMSRRDVKRILRLGHKTLFELLPIDLGTDC